MDRWQRNGECYGVVIEPLEAGLNAREPSLPLDAKWAIESLDLSLKIK